MKHNNFNSKNENIGRDSLLEQRNNPKPVLNIIGYKYYELGLFDSNDKRITILKDFLQEKLITYIEEGYEWFITHGSIGIELFAVEVLIELKRLGYHLNIAIIEPFIQQPKDELNDWHIRRNKVIEQVEYHNYIYKKRYEGPWMFKGANLFMMEHSTASLIFYDESSNSNLKYYYNALVDYSSNHVYNILRVSFDELNDFISFNYDN